MEEYEIVSLVKQEVFVYCIPPKSTSRGYKAADWKLDNPDWTGRMRVVSKGDKCIIKLEDKNSGELFAEAPVDKYPGLAVEPVTDSRRYFVLRIEDNNGRAAFIGIGFADRGDAFDFSVTLQEHFKSIENAEKIEKAEQDDANKVNLDLGFKEGQKIKLNLNIGSKAEGARPRPKLGASSGAASILLPPPPKGKIISPPGAKKSSQGSTVQPSKPVAESQSDLLLDLGTLDLNAF